MLITNKLIKLAKNSINLATQKSQNEHKNKCFTSS